MWGEVNFGKVEHRADSSVHETSLVFFTLVHSLQQLGLR